MKYYLYLLIDPRNNKVFYVGKGTGNRAYAHQTIVENHGKDLTGNTEKLNLIVDILNEGLDVIVEKVFESNDEDLCYKKEEDLIQYYDLNNLTKYINQNKVFNFTL